MVRLLRSIPTFLSPISPRIKVSVIMGPENTDNSPMYVLKDVPGKGKGLVALQDIPKGTRILSEQPIISVPERQKNEQWLKAHISQQVQALSDQQRQSFLSMHNLYPSQDPAEQSMGIIRTNALPIDAVGISGGIFLHACRINHACNNNAQKNWNQSIKRHTVHALRDISRGEEITIYYLARDMERALRQSRLREKFGFSCSCTLCSLPPELSQKSDSRIERIAQLDGLIGQDYMRMDFSLRTLRYVDEMVRLYNEQGPGNGGLPRAFFDAAQICIANGDLARGQVFAERAAEGWRSAYGADNEVVKKNSAVAQDPAKCELYGISNKWKRTVQDVPRDLDRNDFEDWLWMREKSRGAEQLGRLRDLRGRDAFPSFDGLPRSYGNVDWYENVDGAYRPTRQWCFLGEIVSSTELHHLELGVTDVDGKNIPLHFYTDGRGREWSESQLRTGYTVGVFYAKRHLFKFGAPGIRLEDAKMLKIFPVSLQKLLELSDRIQQFATKVDGSRTCHGCSKKAPSLNRCGKCSWFWYCNTDCQKTGWNEKDHKRDCKLLKNLDIKALFEGEGNLENL